jgi:hypothetical protein
MCAREELCSCAAGRITAGGESQRRHAGDVIVRHAESPPIKHRQRREHIPRSWKEGMSCERKYMIINALAFCRAEILWKEQENIFFFDAKSLVHQS